MTADLQEQVRVLRDQAAVLPNSAAKVALLEDAVRFADSAGDLDLAYSTRDDLMSASIFSGRTDLTLVVFAWKLAQFDREPDRFSRHTLLWQYKWVVGNCCKFPSITRSQMESLLADMERRFREAGSTLHAVAEERTDFFLHFGELKEARKSHAAYRKIARDSLSNCYACTANTEAYYYRQLKQWKRATKEYESILQRGLTCSTQPLSTYANILLPLMILGRVEEARNYHRQGYRLVSRDPHFIAQQASHLEFLALAGDPAKAKQVLERHLPAALETVEVDERRDFLESAYLWALRQQARGIRKIKTRLPKQLPAPDADGKVEIAALVEWFAREAEELGRKFDARNGTDRFQRAFQELPELLQYAV